MTDDTAPTHLNNHHRDTIAAIFRHPAGHNIEWVDVISLLEAIGTVDEGRDNKYTTRRPSSSSLMGPSDLAREGPDRCRMNSPTEGGTK